VRVVIAPDSFGGTLTAPEAGRAIAAGWRRARPEDEVDVVAMSDGGEGLLTAVARPTDSWMETEVAGPHGLPRVARWLRRGDRTAIIESAEACGLRLLATDGRSPLRTTTYGVGQLLDAARDAGCTRILVGLGGSSTVDGGAGALTALGFHLRVEDGSGLKIGGRDLHRVASADRGWAADWGDVEVSLLADVTTALDDAAERFGPQKGAMPDDVVVLRDGLRAWAGVVERDLAGPELREAAGSGAAGGLGYGLAAGIGGRLTNGAITVAALVGLPLALAAADLVVTGEGRLDGTSSDGKVVDAIVALAMLSGDARVLAVAGGVDEQPSGVHDVEASAPDGPGDDPAEEVAAAAERLARRCP